MFEVIIKVDKTFAEAISFLTASEKIEIKGDKIRIKHKEVSKLRANTNLILRCLGIHQKLKEFINDE